MDLWVIAATAATGYIAKQLQNLSKGRAKLHELSSEEINNGKPESPVCPSSRLTRGKRPDDDILTVGRKKLGRRNPDSWKSDDTRETELGESSKIGQGDLVTEGVCSNNFADVSEGESGIYAFDGHFKNGTFLRRKPQYGRLVKPLSSIESCLMAQLQNQITMEEYMLCPFPSPSTPITRPLLVTDGTRVIGRISGDYFNMQIQKEDKHEHVYGFPPPSKLESVDLSYKVKPKTRKGLLGRSKSSHKPLSGRHMRLQRGSRDAAILFCLGISIGMISTFIASKNEVDRLNKVLKQTENLVQDLQDELDMNDSLTVKELSNENPESNDNHCLSQKKMKELEDGNKTCDEKGEENLESMSKIEAELEAELERLELNINTSGIERRLSDIIELDPDFAADFAQGELRADRITGQASDHVESNQDWSGNSTPHSGNYTVSPRELSLCLHEVIQAQLEDRIKELEAALQESQRKVEKLTGSERKTSWPKLCETHAAASCDFENDSPTTQALVMSLAGEALDAYNEAYEELMKINDSEEDDSFTSSSQKDYVMGFSRTSEELSTSQKRSTDKHKDFSRVQELLDVGMSEEDEEEKSDFKDEMETQLIQQIIEKTKQGSPVVLNAQRMFFLMDDEK